MNSLFQLGARQRAILDIVWANDEIDVARTRAEFQQQNVRLAYTTVLTVMQKLERAGWLKHRRVGRRYVYSATLTRAAALTEATSRLVEEWWGGDEMAVAEQLLELRRPRPISMRERLTRRRLVG